MNTMLQFMLRSSWWLFRVLASRVFIVVFMLGLLIASHTISFVASATMAALSTASRIVSSQPFTPRSVAGLQIQNDQLRNQAAIRRRAVNANLRRVRTRTQRAAVAQVSAIGGKALPFVGIGVIAAATVYEVNLACENMSDLYDLQVEIDPAQANPADRDIVCGLQVPTKDELWSSIRTAPGAVWDRAVGASESTADWAGSLERPSFGSIWQNSVNVVGDWFD